MLNRILDASSSYMSEGQDGAYIRGEQGAFDYADAGFMGKLSPRRVLGGEVDKALDTKDSCKREL